MPKEMDESVLTDEGEFDPMATPKPDQYVGTDEEKQIIGFVNNRLQKMYYARESFPRRWNIYEDMVKARYKPLPSGKYRYGTALTRALRDIAVTNLKDRPPKPKIEGEHGFEQQAMAAQYVWDFDWQAHERQKELLLDDYICAEKGTSILYTGFEVEKRIIHDPIDEYADAETRKYKKMLETKSKCVFKSFDLRRFFVDDRAYTMDDAEDCMAIQMIPQGAFFSFKLNSSYGYKNLDSVVANQNYFSQWEILPFTTEDERGKIWSNYIRLVHYYNKVSDTYIIVANQNVVIYEGHLENARHELPFTIRQFFRNTNSIYGTGIPEIIMPFIDKFNKAFDIYIDAAYRSNQQVIAIGGNLGFDGQTFQFANNFLKFRGDFTDQNFKQLTGIPPNNSINQLIDSLYQEITVNTGIDIKSIIDPGSQTAYQTAIKQNISVKRMANVIDNRDSAHQRAFTQHLNNILEHYPKDVVNQLVEVDDDNEPKDEAEQEPMSIPIEGKKFSKGKFKQAEGKNLFQITPERIRGQMKVTINTSFNAPTIPEVEKQQTMEFYSQGLMGIANAYQAVPEMQNIKPKTEAITEMAHLFNIDTQESQQQKVKEMKNQLFTKMNTLYQSVSNPQAQ